MNGRMMAMGMASVLFVAANAMALEDAVLDRLWEEVLVLNKQMDDANGKLRQARGLLQTLGETVPDGRIEALDKARTALKAAEAAHEAAMKAAGMDRRKSELQTAQRERDARTDAILKDVPRFQEMLRKEAAARKQAEELSARLPRLSFEEVKALHQARQDSDQGAYHTRVVFWPRGEVGEAYLDAKTKYVSYGAALGKDAAIVAASATVKTAKKDLDSALAEAARTVPEGKKIQAEIAALEAELTRLRTESGQKNREVEGSEWKTVKVDLPVSAEEQKRAKKGSKVARESTIELPPGHERVRAVFLSFAAGVSGNSYARGVCAAEGVAIVRISDRRIGIFNYTNEAPAALMEHLDALAAKSGHPEVRVAPWITAGCSASTLTARNVAYWKPERTVCAISFAGGNLHQNIDPDRTLKGVPFLCINGEFEPCGPEGGGHSSGVAGIRPEYGLQTQWVMIREQLLRWRAKDPAYLVNLIVLPGAGHASGSIHMSRPMGLFIRKAIRARVPKTEARAGEPVQCLPIRPESGWLTDQDITTPAYPPTPCSEFKGNPAQAFWHFDKELAEASEAVHRDGIWLPDPTKQHPVPADWPEKQ